MPTHPVDLYIDCVVLTSFDGEFTFLRNVFRPAGIRMHHAQTLEDANFLLAVTGSTVLATDVTFADGSWEYAVRLLTFSYPLVAMLVIADPVDRPFLSNLYPHGACGVIWKPFDFDQVRRRIRAAHEASRDRQAIIKERESAPDVLRTSF